MTGIQTCVGANSAPACSPQTRDASIPASKGCSTRCPNPFVSSKALPTVVKAAPVGAIVGTK